MEAAAGCERRQHIRRRVEVDVMLSHGTSPAEGARVTVHDISLSGMAICPGTIKTKLDDKLCLCLAYQDGECSQDHIIEATVVHVRNGIVGIRFDSVGVHILDDIHRLLRGERIF